MELSRLALLVLAACSGGKARNVDDARSTHPEPPRDARVDPSGKGDVQVRVEWKNVPVAARASPGRSTCGTARAAAVAPTTTWGIPDAIVELGDTGAPGTPSPTAKRIALVDCALTPRAVVATTLLVASASEQPAKLALQPIGKLPLGGAAVPGSVTRGRDLYLPIAGHEVDVGLDAGTIYTLQLGDEVATIVASDSPFVAVTEASGQVVLRGVPAGTHAVTAWLPARSGQLARVARGKVTVTAGALAEATLDLTTP